MLFWGSLFMKLMLLKLMDVECKEYFYDVMVLVFLFFIGGYLLCYFKFVNNNWI